MTITNAYPQAKQLSEGACLCEHRFSRPLFTKALMLLGVLAVFSHNAKAQDDFKIGAAGVRGKISTSVTVATGMRTSDPDRSLIGTSFGSDGKPKGGTGTDSNDDGELNYRRGDLFSTPYQFFSRVEMSKSRYSVVLSAKGWVDATLVNHPVVQGNIPNGNALNDTLSDKGLTRLNKFAAFAPWELYATAQLSDHSYIRVGRQVLNWSVARFFSDTSRITASDVPALLRPGSLPDREGSIPTGMVAVNAQGGGPFAIEAFYQLEQRATNLPACGTFFNTVDVGIDPSCNQLVANTFTGVNALFLPASAAVWDNSAFSLANHETITRSPNRYEHSHEQGGIAIHYHAPKDALDVRVYALNLQPHIPMLAVISNNYAPVIPDAALLAAGAPVGYAGLGALMRNLGYFYDYPGNVQTIGVNASASKLFGFQAGAEAEYTLNLPVQYNPADIIVALLGGTSPLTHFFQGAPASTSMLDNEKLHNLKVDLNLGRTILNVLKSKQLTVFAEVEDQGVTDLPSLSQARFGRAFQYAFSSEGFGGLAACDAVKSPLSQNMSGCFNKGFVTANAVGYRLRMAMTYRLGPNLNVSPTVSWLHDVRGNSPDKQIVEGRGVVTPSLEWTWNKKYFGAITYATRALAGAYWDSKDRNNVQLSTGVNF